MALNPTLSNVDELSHVALQRLTLRMYAETHRIFLPFQTWIVNKINAAATPTGGVDPLKIPISEVEGRFRRVVQEWIQVFEAARENAAGIPFGVLVVQHNAYMSGVEEQLTADEINSIVRLWNVRRQAALRATQTRVYGDGLILSQRIWRLEQDGLLRIRRELATAFSERTSAEGLARRMEYLLGAGQEMPRWALDRLYGMTPRQRASSTYGLLRDPQFRSTGISYNALRLARTELQFAHHAVSTDIAVHSPWVTGRYTVLSPEHPAIDICDTYASGGPYPKGDEILPLHPNCMCFYKEALMATDQFHREVRGWLRGENSFLTEYQSWVGMRQPTHLLSPSMALADLMEAWISLGSSDHARLLRVA